MSNSRTLRAGVCAAVIALAVAGGLAQSPSSGGTVERVKVHGRSLEGNLEGDAPDRDVSIYLPHSYATSRTQRYPVVYLLHGFTDSDDQWFGHVQHFINVPQVANRAMTSGGVREAIIVMPNAFTRFGGSMYSSSVTTGDWETFIARELVAYVDSHYRTLASPAGRGLAGHSMGGYGALRLGMKFPDVFSSIYALSPCCMSANVTPMRGDGPSRAELVTTFEQVAKADFGTKAQLASAAAWSPNPKNPPFFFDLPTRNGEPQPQTIARWAANAPLAMVDQYLANLKRLRAIAFDAGDKDSGIAGTVRTLNAILTANGVAHGFEIYEGDHVNRVADRVEKHMLPFFAKQLEHR